MRTYLIALCLLAFAGGAAEAADIPGFPKAGTSPGAQGNGLPASCLEWTDGCRVCLRQKDGSAACSNIGIACVPREARCSRQ